MAPQVGGGLSDVDGAGASGLGGGERPADTPRVMRRTRASRSTVWRAASSPRRAPVSAASRTSSRSCLARCSAAVVAGCPGRWLACPSRTAASTAATRARTWVTVRPWRRGGRAGPRIARSGWESRSCSVQAHARAEGSTRNRAPVTAAEAPVASHRASAARATVGVSWSAGTSPSGSAARPRATERYPTRVEGRQGWSASRNASSSLVTVSEARQQRGSVLSRDARRASASASVPCTVTDT